MKILLFGKNGQVGWELQRSLAPLGEIVALDRHSSPCGDLSRPQDIAATIQNIQPDVIVNAAAYTAVDKAETEQDQARLINATAPAVMAKAARTINALLVHYSTDYVFSGAGDKPWSENDPTEPLNHYGQSKLEGEQAIHQSGCAYLIFRTSWVYGIRGNNFAKTMLRIAKERETLAVIHDQFGAPAGAALIADTTAHAVFNLHNEPSKAGLYHLAPQGTCSWYEYARYVINQAQQLQPCLGWKVHEINPINTAAYPTAACRPLNSRLDSTKLEKAFGLRMPSWQEGVDHFLQEYLQQ